MKNENPAQRNSFESLFLRKNSGQDKENNDNFIENKKKRLTFSERYLKNTHEKKFIPPASDDPDSKYRENKNVSASHNKFHGPERYKEKKGSYTKQILKNKLVYIWNGKQPLKWKFLDLKNKKQTGDLYKQILHQNKKRGLRTFCFTSSRQKEGVSTILANLVDYIKNQATDKIVLILDTNFQSPNLHNIFNIKKNAPGITDVFSNKISIRDAIIPICPNIFLLACGKLSSGKAGNLEPDNFVKLINECKQMADYILIDCPPVLSSGDSLSVAPAADITFLVIQAVKVQKPVAEKAISLLQNNECEIGGVILNCVQQVIPYWIYKRL